MITPFDVTNRAVFAPPMDRRLTDRQTAILHAIESYYDATGEPCPARFLARRLNLHHSTVQEHLERLHRKGWLRGPNAPAVPRERP